MPTYELSRQGEILVFLSDPDLAADRLEFEVRVAPGAEGPKPHRHPRHWEHLRVLGGDSPRRCVVSKRQP